MPWRSTPMNSLKIFILNVFQHLAEQVTDECNQSSQLPIYWWTDLKFLLGIKQFSVFYERPSAFKPRTVDISQQLMRQLTPWPILVPRSQNEIRVRYSRYQCLFQGRLGAVRGLGEGCNKLPEGNVSFVWTRKRATEIGFFFGGRGRAEIFSNFSFHTNTRLSVIFNSLCFLFFVTTWHRTTHMYLNFIINYD